MTDSSSALVVAHSHGGHDHHHHERPADAAGETFWAWVSDIYAGARTALQLTSGLALLGLGRPDARDLRREVLVRVRALLDEAGERLRVAPAAPAGEARYVSNLQRCLNQLREVCRIQQQALTTGEDPASVLEQLEAIGGLLRRCERYDIGIRFFGSGGCADVEHALTHH